MPDLQCRTRRLAATDRRRLLGNQRCAGGRVGQPHIPSACLCAVPSCRGPVSLSLALYFEPIRWRASSWLGRRILYAAGLRWRRLYPAGGSADKRHCLTRRRSHSHLGGGYSPPLARLACFSSENLEALRGFIGCCLMLAGHADAQLVPIYLERRRTLATVRQEACGATN